MERSRGDSVTTLRWANQASKLFFIPFFIFHYGMFCFVHGVFLFAIFDREGGGFEPFGGFANFEHVLDTAAPLALRPRPRGEPSRIRSSQTTSAAANIGGPSSRCS